MKRREFLFKTFQAGAAVGLAITFNQSLLAAVAPEEPKNTLARMRQMWADIENEQNHIGYFQLGKDAYANMWDEIHDGTLLKGHANPYKLFKFQGVPLKVEDSLPPDHIKAFVNVKNEVAYRKFANGDIVPDDYEYPQEQDASDWPSIFSVLKPSRFFTVSKGVA